MFFYRFAVGSLHPKPMKGGEFAMAEPYKDMYQHLYKKLYALRRIFKSLDVILDDALFESRHIFHDHLDTELQIDEEKNIGKAFREFFDSI